MTAAGLLALLTGRSAVPPRPAPLPNGAAAAGNNSGNRTRLFPERFWAGQIRADSGRHVPSAAPGRRSRFSPHQHHVVERHAARALLRRTWQHPPVRIEEILCVLARSCRCQSSRPPPGAGLRPFRGSDGVVQEPGPPPPVTILSLSRSCTIPTSSQPLPFVVAHPASAYPDTRAYSVGLPARRRRLRDAGSFRTASERLSGISEAPGTIPHGATEQGSPQPSPEETSSISPAGEWSHG